MGKIIHLKKLREFFLKTPIFRMRDVELVVKNKNYSYLLLHNLAKKGEIKRVAKGWYSLSEDPSVAVYYFKPAYIGLQEALSSHEIWEQETNVVIITCRKVRTGIRNILGSNVILHRLNKKYLFGFEYVKHGDFFMPVSDIEKTFIDLVYFNEIPDKSVLKEIKKRIDKGKLNSYLKHYPLRFRKRLHELIT